MPRGPPAPTFPARRARHAFQSAFLCGGRPPKLLGCSSLAPTFQSAFLCGERQRVAAHRVHAWAVSIRVPVRGTAVFEVAKITSPLGFNPRSCAGNGTETLWTALRSFQFQSAFLCGERPPGRQGAVADDPVSIRVPVRGTAHRHAVGRPGHQVSIRVPVRGTAAVWAGSLTTVTEFQSAFLCGERPLRARDGVPASAVSIRVPVRGTAIKDLANRRRAHVSIRVPVRGTAPLVAGSTWRLWGFNPRSCAGNGSSLSVGLASRGSRFQSAFLCGERLSHTII